MSTVAESDLASVADAGACRQWLDALPGDSADRLSAIGRLLVRIGRPDLPVDAVVAILEQVRTELLDTVDRCLAPVEGRQMPYGADAWRRVTDALTTLRALRTMYKRAGSRMAREAQARLAGADAPQAEPGGGTTLPSLPDASTEEGAARAARLALPMLRALDVQARVVATLLVHRVEPLAEDWDELCALGGHARRNALLDAKVPDAAPLVRPVTARALFVYPLLLRLAGLPGRSRAELALVVRLASRLAAQIGFRVDAGRSRPNPWGPTLALTPASSVRLDTHRIPGLLARRREQWAASAGDAAETGLLEGRSLMALVDDLDRRWSPAQSEPPAGQPLGARAASHLLLQFGLPRMLGPDGGGEMPKAVTEPSGGARGGASGGYVFGQWEQNTIVRLAHAPRVDDRPASAVLDPMAGAESAQCLAASDDRLEVERHLALPPAPQGGLVAVRADPPGGAGDAGVALRLGTVDSVVQLVAPGYARVRAHRLAVSLWPGSATAVGLRLGAARFFDDAWLLAGAVGRQPALVVAPGLAVPGGRATLRERAREIAVRFTAVLDSGPGYERVGFVADQPPDG